MHRPESSYVPFEQLVAFCEGRLSGVAAEQVREKAMCNPLIQETITNLRSQLQTGNSQNLQLMIDQSLDQFLTHTFAKKFQSNQETSNRRLWPNRVPFLLRGRKTLRRQALLLTTLVLTILLAYLLYQSRVFSGETNENGPVANVPVLVGPVDSFSTPAEENTAVFDGELVPDNESLDFSSETKATDAVANASNLAFPDSFTAQADDILDPSSMQKQESLRLSGKTKATTLSTKAELGALPDTTSAAAAGNDEALNANSVREIDSLLRLAEAKTTTSMGNDPTLVFPDGFTPNGDGLNDVFQPKLLKKVSLFHEFTIYDRWGELAYKATNFSTKSVKKGWDGTIDGQAAPEATYVYIVRLRTALGVEETFNGTFRLKR